MDKKGENSSLSLLIESYNTSSDEEELVRATVAAEKDFFPCKKLPKDIQECVKALAASFSCSISSSSDKEGKFDNLFLSLLYFISNFKTRQRKKVQYPKSRFIIVTAVPETPEEDLPTPERPEKEKKAARNGENVNYMCKELF